MQRYGGLPASLMNTGFKMLRPTLEAQALSGLWANVNRPGYAEWLQGDEPLGQRLSSECPDRFFQQLSDDMYAKQPAVERRTGAQWAQGRPGAPSSQPLLVVAANQDFIVPAHRAPAA